MFVYRRFLQKYIHAWMHTVSLYTCTHAYQRDIISHYLTSRWILLALLVLTLTQYVHRYITSTWILTLTKYIISLHPATWLLSLWPCHERSCATCQGLRGEASRVQSVGCGVADRSQVAVVSGQGTVFTEMVALYCQFFYAMLWIQGCWLLMIMLRTF